MSDPAPFAGPLSADDAAGPDLDDAGDHEYLRVMARLEGSLPGSYFQFDRSGFPFEAEYRDLGEQLARSRDLRLAVLWTKLRALQGDLAGMAAAVEGMAGWLDDFWAEAHPRPMASDLALRTVALETLDDPPHTLFPLQAMPILEDRRLGALTFRMVQIANGALRAREGEEVPALLAIESALRGADPGLLAAQRDRLSRLETGLDRIRAAYAEHDAILDAPSFERLLPLVRAMRGLLDGVIGGPAEAAAGAGAATSAGAAGDPTTASAGGSTAVSVRSQADVRRALSAVERYYQLREPSSPVLLLVRQARALAGQPFNATIQLFFAEHTSRAIIPLAPPLTVGLALTQLAELPGEDAVADEAATDEAPELATPTSRGEALAVAAAVADYLRRAEPASPLPLLLDRARQLAERSFLDLIKDTLPPEAYRTES